MIFEQGELNVGGADSKGNETGSHAAMIGRMQPPILSNIAKFINVQNTNMHRFAHL